jgi:hypothetical protein
MTLQPEPEPSVFFRTIATSLSERNAAKAKVPSRMPIFIMGGALLLFGSIAGSREAEAARRSEGGIPSLNINEGCQYLTKREQDRKPAPEPGSANNADNGINYSGCIAEENAARTQLQGVWRNYSASQRELCMYSVTPPALPSYVTLQGCLDMARDGEKYTKNFIGSDINTNLGPNFEGRR